MKLFFPRLIDKCRRRERPRPISQWTFHGVNSDRFFIMVLFFFSRAARNRIFSQGVCHAMRDIYALLQMSSYLETEVMKLFFPRLIDKCRRRERPRPISQWTFHGVNSDRFLRFRFPRYWQSNLLLRHLPCLSLTPFVFFVPTPPTCPTATCN